MSLKVGGYVNGGALLNDFSREWGQRKDLSATVNAFVPLFFDPRRAFQLDWRE